MNGLDEESKFVIDCSDLDNFCMSFDSWQNITFGLSEENTELKDNIESMKKENLELINQLNDIVKDNERIMVCHDQMLKKLNYICELETDLRKLKETIALKDEEICQMKAASNKARLQHESEIKKIRDDHQTHLAKKEEETKEKREADESVFKGEITRKDGKIEELESTLEEREKEAQKDKMKDVYGLRSQDHKIKAESCSRHGKSTGIGESRYLPYEITEHEAGTRLYGETSYSKL